jgi:hypothetical protein
MAGLVPAIHVLAVAAKNVDARHKAGMTEYDGLTATKPRGGGARVFRSAPLTIFLPLRPAALFV